MGHGVEDDDGLGRELQRQDHPVAGPQIDRVEDAVRLEPREGLRVRKGDGGREEHVAEIVPEGEAFGRMRGDAADARRHREADLDRVVEDRLAVERAEGAVIVLLPDALQRRARVEHAAAARADDVPRGFEEPEPRRVEEGRDHRLLVKVLSRREVERVDPRELPVAALAHQRRDRRHGLPVG